MDRSERRDAVAYAALATTLLVWFAAPGILRGFSFPVGPDAPVYLWWTRLAGMDGLSAVTRPGVPALALLVSGTLGAPVSAVLAALEIVGGMLVGVVAATLLRSTRPDDRATWVLGGLLAGTFAVHIATGYLATLVFAVLFLVAAVALVARTRRGSLAATLLLGAGAIAHPRFLAVGAAILVLAAALAWSEDRREAVRLVAVAAGAAAILGLAGLALLVGPSPLLADTSRDAFLRRAGLGEILRRAYLTRFLARWTRYAPWGVLPLASLGASSILRRGGHRTTVDCILLAWIAVTGGGAIAAAATGLLPVDRFVTFAFAAPLLAAIGATRFARMRSLPTALARSAAAVFVVAMLSGAGIAWLRQEPFVDDRALAALRVGNAVAVAAPDTVLIVPVEPERSAFLLTLTGNAVRAAVPPDRIRDVVVVAGPGSSLGAEAAAMVERTAEDARDAVATAGGQVQRIRFVPFAGTTDPAAPWAEVAADVAVDPSPSGFASSATREPIEPYAPWLPSVLAVIALLLFGGIGRSWTRLTVGSDAATTVAIAPAFGIGCAILLAFVLERIGVPLSGRAGPLGVSAVALAAGPLVARWSHRRGITRRSSAGA